ncbi:unnamed protein product [Caretta caretta]
MEAETATGGCKTAPPLHEAKPWNYFALGLDCFTFPLEVDRLASCRARCHGPGLEHWTAVNQGRRWRQPISVLPHSGEFSCLVDHLCLPHPKVAVTPGLFDGGEGTD